MIIPSKKNPRDPEDRVIDEQSDVERKEKMLDKTLADSFPASDPPSSLPDPDYDSFSVINEMKNVNHSKSE
jgi:hypothetical protein